MNAEDHLQPIADDIPPVNNEHPVIADGGSLSYSFLSILMLTPLCLLFIPGFFILHFYEAWKGRADTWNWVGQYLKIIFVSLAFWTCLASLCILICG